jgi:transaldolase
MSRPQPDARIAAVLADVDGTLVTKDKVLTERALAAVRQLHDRGLVFTITSGRPPFGMRMLIDPLGLKLPMAAFNGGVLLLPDLSILDERLVPEYLLPSLIDVLENHGLDVFLFRSHDWFVRSLSAPHVARESTTIQQPPKQVASFDDVLTGVAKVTGVSDDHPRVEACEAAMQRAFGAQVSAVRSQPHYLDITHPSANKGVVIERLSRYLNIPLDRFATLGDQPNDLLMFERSGLSIAMENANDEVKRRATFVTTSYTDEGFANAVERIILPRAEPAGGPGASPTAWLHRLGQSLWLDSITRDRIRTGTLQHCIDELSVSGLTWNPTSVEKALANSTAYDASIAELSRRRLTGEDLVYELALDDLGQAADLLAPVYERSAGVDGWVSLQLSPRLAHDAKGTIAAAKALFARAARPNLMIEIPGTPAGLEAIEEVVFAGIPVNVTLLFSREHYLAAADAFLRGLERRVEAGRRPDVASVASMFIGRWDTAIANRVPAHLRAKLGIAMAQRTYRAYRSLLHSARWQHSYNAGARPQRLVWASTGTEDPMLSEVSYVKSLAAPFTVISLPQATLEAIAAHGEITRLLRADGDTCEATLDELEAAGIDPFVLGTQLQEDGTSSFVRSWNQLMRLLATKAGTVARSEAPTCPGPRK